MRDQDPLTAGMAQLVPIPQVAQESYAGHLAELTAAVDAVLLAREDVSALTGNTPTRMMTDNHRNHGAFMSTVFRLNHFQLLATTVPWVYRTYHALGFSYDYFPVELRAWKKAILSVVGEQAAPILAVYDWMLSVHDDMVCLAERPPSVAPPPPPEWQGVASSFLEALLKGDQRAAVAVAEKAAKDDGTLTGVYMYVVQWALYEIGSRWERGEMSVAQEHLASAIAARTMAAVYLTLPGVKIGGDRAMVATAPGERHEMGAWMISDALEEEGWDVRYVGADAPESDLLRLLHQLKPRLFVLSVTMPFFVHEAASLVGKIKNDPSLADVRVMVGGQVFNSNSELWKTTKADATAGSVAEVVALTREWRTQNT